MNTTMRNKAFTLVEILIVVIILGILAAIIVPKFSTASATARASMMADDLRLMRTQIAVFKSQHTDVPPGYVGLVIGATADEPTFIQHMTTVTTCVGRNFGPYLREMPVNPINNKSTIEIIADGTTFPVAGDNSHGWIYQPSTMTFKADSPGADDSNKAFIDY
ncbi:MAG: prepilin-type N-terminal cleavage/methylation domain-containing protein [Planctomycetaceae bacterium]|nr:MAG: prepilin-type N-terminal cleavage/methylation domain-containing protein [Planctomycetaceae bacterium]